MKVLLVYLEGATKEAVDIVTEGLSGAEISNQIKFVASEAVSHIVIDCRQLHTKEQFDKSRAKILASMWLIYRKINTPRQQGQKKVRLNNRQN